KHQLITIIDLLMLLFDHDHVLSPQHHVSGMTQATIAMEWALTYFCAFALTGRPKGPADAPPRKFHLNVILRARAARRATLIPWDRTMRW
ncbi:hypothetical protein ABTF77_20660, partial [Acinetobacter baumannii]